MTQKKRKAVKPKVAKRMRPRDARSLNQICSMPRDNMECRGFWMMLNGDGTCSVTITAQRVGESPTQQINIPRRVFDLFVDWYMKPVVRRLP